MELLRFIERRAHRFFTHLNHGSFKGNKIIATSLLEPDY